MQASKKGTTESNMEGRHTVASHLWKEHGVMVLLLRAAGSHPHITIKCAVPLEVPATLG